jgi:nucleoside-diphosphate kinase
MPKERTFIMVKPSGTQRSLIGNVVERFEKRGFKLVAMKLCSPGKARFEEHYSDLSKKGFFKDLVEHSASAPVCAMCWEGDQVITTGRKILGETHPKNSELGTLRGDFCIDVGRNLLHGSDCVEAANKEIALWFNKNELVNWDDHGHNWVYEAPAEAKAPAVAGGKGKQNAPATAAPPVIASAPIGELETLLGKQLWVGGD